MNSNLKFTDNLCAHKDLLHRQSIIRSVIESISTIRNDKRFLTKENNLKITSYIKKLNYSR